MPDPMQFVYKNSEQKPQTVKVEPPKVEQQVKTNFTALVTAVKKDPNYQNKNGKRNFFSFFPRLLR